MQGRNVAAAPERRQHGGVSLSPVMIAVLLAAYLLMTLRPWNAFLSTRGSQPQRPQKLASVAVSLEQAYSGAEMHLSFDRVVSCPHCKGSGAESPGDITLCPRCGGHGVVEVARKLGPGFIVQSEMPCPVCGGAGRSVARKCHVCHGAGRIREKKEIVLNVPRGVPDGHRVLFSGVADEDASGVAGDMAVDIHVDKHETFERAGDDLSTPLTVSLLDALVGFETELQHLDGHAVHIAVTNVTQPGAVLHFPQEGMPLIAKDSFGSLHVTVAVDFPDWLSDEQRKEVARLLPKET